MFKKPLYGHFSVDHVCMDGEALFKTQEGLSAKVGGELMGDNKDSYLLSHVIFTAPHFISLLHLQSVTTDWWGFGF